MGTGLEKLQLRELVIRLLSACAHQQSHIYEKSVDETLPNPHSNNWIRLGCYDAKGYLEDLVQDLHIVGFLVWVSSGSGVGNQSLSV
jgi:hypothetical protein